MIQKLIAEGRMISEAADELLERAQATVPDDNAAYLALLTAAIKLASTQHIDAKTFHEMTNKLWGPVAGLVRLAPTESVYVCPSCNMSIHTSLDVGENDLIACICGGIFCLTNNGLVIMQDAEVERIVEKLPDEVRAQIRDYRARFPCRKTTGCFLRHNHDGDCL